MHTYAKGINDHICNSRREKLDHWLREIVMNPGIILDPESRNIIYDFLEVDCARFDNSYE